VKTECYWKCYSYGDDLIPIFEFIDDLRNRSVKELLSANSEQTEEHIEKQDKVKKRMQIGSGKVRPQKIVRLKEAIGIRRRRAQVDTQTDK
jgi:hypothetical protein